MGRARVLFLILALACGRAAADSISVPVPACTSSSRITADGQQLDASGYASVASPGDPSLPFKEINIILPPNADPDSVTARLSGHTTRQTPIQADIAPAPPLVASFNGREIRDWGRGKQIRGNRNALVYDRSALYPDSNVRLESVGRLRTWQIATLRYYPYRYNPVTRELEQITSGSIVLNYATSRKVEASRRMRGSDSALSNEVQSIAANYQQAQAWYSAGVSATASQQAQSSSVTDYLIITTAAIVNASTKLQAFINHKMARGFSVGVATEADWGGGTGDTAATNIRSYLQGHYLSQGIRYVLLIGNPDPVAGSVPMKMLWPRYTSSTYREAPSDYFYADLTGDWDLNGNGYYGEEDGDFGPGGIDRFPEVIVGRIPFYGSFSDLDSILQKTINYETNASPGGWVRSAILSMKPSDSTTPGYQLGEAIKNDVLTPAAMQAVRIYDSDYGLNPAPEHLPCTYANVLSAWQQHAGFHFWWTHGNETLAADVCDSSTSQGLDDSYSSFTFQCSCLNACPERSDNLAYSLLKRGAIAADAATRVSWYYLGQTAFALSDSNSGMTYDYAKKLIAENMPCGDAHYAMMLEVPNEIWMNHCVFNLYGDPSVSYPMAPVISHTPLRDTDATAQPYIVQADIKTTSPLAPNSPDLRWSTNGGSTFNTSSMHLVSGTESTYRAPIPAQPYGTTVCYYLQAADTANLSSNYPADAPQSLVSFQVRPDTAAPTIIHTPLADTPDKFGPYIVNATVTDDMGIGSVALHYSINGSAYTQAGMSLLSGDIYQGSIPGPTQPGDTISYYITATDSSINANTSRLPVEGCYSFHIGQKIYVAVYNSTEKPGYFTFGISNDWRDVSTALADDPSHRFQVSVITNLVPTPGSVSIEGQDVLVLPDNAVPYASMQAVANWFQPGKVIVVMDSSIAYAAYTGWLWSGTTGTNGWGTYWDNSSQYGDQRIWALDPITSGYSVGQTIGSSSGKATAFVDKLPSDARVLAVQAKNNNLAYALYRDVPGRGRLVFLGPYIAPSVDQYSIVREAAIGPSFARQLHLLTPNGGETYKAGDQISVYFSYSGAWQDTDKVRLEYRNDMDPSWQPVPGAESLSYAAGTFQWDTTGLHGSHHYRVRATWTGADLSDGSDADFTVLPTVDIPAAKWVDDGELIELAGKVVTSTKAGFSYVEEPDRKAGIRVSDSSDLPSSSLVDLIGTMATSNGERVLVVESVQTVGAGAQIRPLAIKASSLGGSEFGFQQTVMGRRGEDTYGTAGLNNIGLLTRIAGKVTAVGDGFFYLDDDSGCADSYCTQGVRVICPQMPSVSIDNRAIVDGVSSIYFDGTTAWRALILPDRQSLKVQP